MTVIERVAEYFVHPVGASGGNPRVLVGVPTVGESKSGVSVRNLTHFYLLLSVQALRQVACRAHAHYAVVADRNSAFVSLLGGNEYTTAGT